jgi:hypothetical protein
VQSTLVEDSEARPDLFAFRLPNSPSEIAALESRIHARLPPSYRDVLETIGQGSFFDNETLLGVHEAEEGVGDLEQVNRELHLKQGLPENLIVFHIGLNGMHAFDTETPGPEHEVVALHEDTLARGEVYEGFEDWYLACIREEYESLLDLE